MKHSASVSIGGDVYFSSSVEFFSRPELRPSKRELLSFDNHAFIEMHGSIVLDEQASKDFTNWHNNILATDKMDFEEFYKNKIASPPYKVGDIVGVNSDDFSIIIYKPQNCGPTQGWASYIPPGFFIKEK